MDIPAELERREKRLEVIAAAKAEYNEKRAKRDAHCGPALSGTPVKGATGEFRINHVLGFRQFLLRGLRAVQAE